jgi:hypothetical protein
MHPETAISGQTMKLAAARALVAARNKICVQKPRSRLPTYRKWPRTLFLIMRRPFSARRMRASGRHWQFLIRGRFHHFSDTGSGELALHGHPRVGPWGLGKARQYAPKPGFHRMPTLWTLKPSDRGGEKPSRGAHGRVQGSRLSPGVEPGRDGSDSFPKLRGG